MSRVCTCSICRRTIRRQIESTFIERPRWMGERRIRKYGRLGWVPRLFFRHILGRMVLLGIVIKLMPARKHRTPVYLLARCMAPAQALAASVEGGDS